MWKENKLPKFMTEFMIQDTSKSVMLFYIHVQIDSIVSGLG